MTEDSVVPVPMFRVDDDRLMIGLVVRKSINAPFLCQEDGETRTIMWRRLAKTASQK